MLQRHNNATDTISAKNNMLQTQNVRENRTEEPNIAGPDKELVTDIIDRKKVATRKRMTT